MLTVVAASAGVVCAGDAVAEFETAYGAEYRRVLGTAVKDDDVELAGRLLVVAKGIKGDVAGVRLLAEKICDLATGIGMAAPAGVRDTGYELAVEAIQLAMAAGTADKTPPRPGAPGTPGRDAATGGKTSGQSAGAAGEGGGGAGVVWADKLIDIRTRQWREASREKRASAGEALAKLLIGRGDEQVRSGDLKSAGESYERARAASASADRAELTAEISRKQKDLVALRLLHQRRDALEAQLKSSPDDEAARENLVLFCLIEQDSPADAAKFLADDDASEQASNIRRSAKGAGTLPPGTALEVGRWYRQLGSRASSEGGKQAMLSRAKDFYERFLQLHPATDLARAAAQAELDQIMVRSWS